MNSAFDLISFTRLLPSPLSKRNRDSDQNRNACPIPWLTGTHPIFSSSSTVIVRPSELAFPDLARCAKGSSSRTVAKAGGRGMTCEGIVLGVHTSENPTGSDFLGSSVPFGAP